VSVFELAIDARPSEVGRVRRAIRAALVRYGLDPAHADTVQLLASELVMNAVLHGEAPVVVRLSVDGGATTIEVVDAGDLLPVLADDDGVTTRGLRVVNTLCTDWGVVSHPGDGKTVWCTLRHDQRTEPAAGVAEGSAGHRRRAADGRPS